MAQDKLKRKRGDIMSRLERKKTWTSLEIDQWRKKEIMAICRQYDEFQTELLQNQKMIQREDRESAEAAMAKNVILYKKINTVESAIKTVCPEIYDQMLDNIARGVSYKDLNVQMSQADFFAKRIAVFEILHKVLN